MTEISEALIRDLERDAEMPADEWSGRLWSPPPNPYFEAAFRRALSDELRDRLGDDVDRLVSEIERTGSVITAHHVCPTNGPTFGAMDFIAAVGQSGPILVLAWSGVSMSNAASSGSLCFGSARYDDLMQPGSAELKRQVEASRSRAADGVSERRLVLVPPHLRDALVYECALPARLEEVLSSATPRLRQVIRSPTDAETYSAWALHSNESMSRSVFSHANIWYVDLNRVAKRYLLEVLGDPKHVMNEWLRSTAAGLRRWPWFYGRREHKNRERVVTILEKPDRLIERLRTTELCPGLMPVFCALRSLSRVRLLGGVRQVEYVEEMAKTLLSCGLITRDEGVRGALLTGSLTTSVGLPLYPFDVAVGAVSRDELPNASTRMRTLWSETLGRARVVPVNAVENFARNRAGD